ncbi:MULE domain-containing protein [Trichostrongylus colubriformis]|uniref:MULE domain-containing protein n=1 Tax=Trichostrongylus colubriformis TaxID=6319 RepID=A0AAN8IQD2_TRICO
MISSDALMAWRKKEENDHVLQWAKTSVTKTGDRKTSYFRCSRAIPYPGYALTQGHKSKKDVLYCTAFLRVSEERRGIAVTYCNKHIGHAEDPALLSIDKESESYIILRKIRTDFRNKKIKTRLYFTTAKDIRNIAARNNVVPGRKHAFDIQSVEMRVNEASEEDGIRRYIPAIDETGDGFLLVVITPVQKSWITRYGRRGISIDDTFNLTRYSLRLATVIVADEWDMGLPAAYLLSYRMTEEEVFKLFSEIKEVAPDFNPKLFMTDDTNSFYNGFQRAFPHAATVKLLCCFHVLQAIKRNCKAKLIEKKHTGMVMSKVRSLCRSADRSDFTTKYSTLLTHLQELGEHQFCSYMEDTWSHRVQQWGGFARENAVMNTSMLGERFHKRLKHELPDSKPNMRLDRLLETIISLAAELEEDRTIRMRRGLLDGRYRLLQQHHQHEEAVKWYRERQEDVKEYSVIRSNALKISKIADDEVYQSLEKVRQLLRSIRFEIEDTVRSKCTQKKTRQTEIVRRAEVPISGGPSRDPPIRKFQPVSFKIPQV